MKTKIRIPEDLSEWYIKQIEDNRKIYDEILKTYSNQDIGILSKGIFDVHEKTDLFKAFVQRKYYENKWFDITYRISETKLRVHSI